MALETGDRQGDSLLAHTFVTMICHGVLLTGLVVVFVMVVPKFQSMFEAFNTMLPAPTNLIFDISGFMRRYVVFVLLSVPVLLVGDAALLTYLQKNVRPVWSFLWSGGVYCLIGSGYFFVITGLFLPVQPRG
ncbi:MAG TPA: hypothetical protein VMZ92_18455 [Planctomycetota bacterium]|nr:hypothetical protein [Planctomycetota bacterium]